MGYVKIWPKSFNGFGILFGLILLALAIGALSASLKGFIDRAFRSARLRKQERLQDLHDLTWQQFEEVVATPIEPGATRSEKSEGLGTGG